MRKNSNSYIFRSVYQIDMKFDRQLRPATETSWVVSYGGKTLPRWRTAAILKIVISPYLSYIIRFSWNFVRRRRFWTGWTSHDRKWKSCIGQTPSSTERISCSDKHLLLWHCVSLPPRGHVWDVMLVWRKGNINRTLSLCYSIVYCYNGAQ